jgi:hypothetical protein
LSKNSRLNLSIANKKSFEDRYAVLKILFDRCPHDRDREHGVWLQESMKPLLQGKHSLEESALQSLMEFTAWHSAGKHDFLKNQYVDHSYLIPTWQLRRDRLVPELVANAEQTPLVIRFLNRFKTTTDTSEGSLELEDVASTFREVVPALARIFDLAK